MEVGWGKSHSIAGVRSSISPAQGSQASTAKTPAQGVRPPRLKILLKASRHPRPKLSCSRQANLHGLISHLHCVVRPTASYVTGSHRMANQMAVCAIRGVICVPLGPNPFYYSLLRKIKLKKEKIEKKKSVWKKTCRNDLVSAMMLVMSVYCRVNIRQGKNSGLKILEGVLYS